MPRGPGPVARQKERIAALRQEIAELNRKGMRLTIQLEEAEAALEQMTGRSRYAREERLPLDDRPV